MPPDVVLAVTGLTGDEAFSTLARWTEPVDWTAVPTRMHLADGSLLRFEKKRRGVVIEQASGGATVIDLGRPDRMRTAAQLLTPGLRREDGPTFELTPNRWTPDRGELAVRDPADPKGKRAPDSAPVGEVTTWRYLDKGGHTQLIGAGDIDTVQGFGTFLNAESTGYAFLRSRSGLGCFHDGRRVGFVKAVTDEHAVQARKQGFAQVVTKAGPIGVVFDCGEPGDYLALSVYGGEHGGTVGTIVDLRRPPVKDGAIVDPPA